MERAVRGAVMLDADKSSEVARWVPRVLHQMLQKNRILERRIISITFSVTRDIVSLNPAAALRREGFADVPLFVVQEAEFESSFPRIIRVLLHYRTGIQLNGLKKPSPVYLNGAEKLRPDIFSGTTPEQ